MDNKIVVDLGPLNLTPAQLKNINAAIQRAVSAELLNIGTLGNVGLFPIDNLEIENNVLINGIIIRDFEKTKFKDLIK